MTMRPLTSLAFVAVVASGAGLALIAAAPAVQSERTPAPSSTSMSASTFDVDDVHSATFFRVQHLGAGQFWGRINDVSGTFTSANGSPEGVRFDITVKASSVDTNTEKLNEHLRSPDFFNAKEFPTLTFKSTGVKAAKQGFFDVTGDFTLHGVTKPVTATVEFTGQKAGKAGDRAGYEATFTIKRSEFGMNYGVDNGMLGDEVRIIVNLEGVKKS
ncbi:MAG: YceI family protein [Phycisphaerae bacterium]|nr:YceI family protein [Phycisphaerae bacterium]